MGTKSKVCTFCYTVVHFEGIYRKAMRSNGLCCILSSRLVIHPGMTGAIK